MKYIKSIIAYLKFINDFNKLFICCVFLILTRTNSVGIINCLITCYVTMQFWLTWELKSLFAKCINEIFMLRNGYESQLKTYIITSYFDDKNFDQN